MHTVSLLIIIIMIITIDILIIIMMMMMNNKNNDDDNNNNDNDNNFACIVKPDLREHTKEANESKKKHKKLSSFKADYLYIDQRNSS